MATISDLPLNIQAILELYCASLDSQSLKELARCALYMVDPCHHDAAWAMPDARIASIVSNGLLLIHPTMTIDIVDPSILETDTSSDDDDAHSDIEEDCGSFLQRSQSCDHATIRQPKTIIAKWEPSQMPK